MGMKYINMYYATKGGYVSGSERFDSAAEAAEKGAKSKNFAMVVPYVPKRFRTDEAEQETQVQVQNQTTVPYSFRTFQRLQQAGTPFVVKTDEDEKATIMYATDDVVCFTFHDDAFGEEADVLLADEDFSAKFARGLVLILGAE